MPNKWLSACLALALWAAHAAPDPRRAPATAAQMAPLPGIELRLSTMAPQGLCTALSPAADHRWQGFERTFFDDFQTLDHTWSRWQPHFDGGYDPVARRWPAYDWPVKRSLQGNGEQQIYVDPGYRGTHAKPLGLNPFVMKDGRLEITASRTPAELRPHLFDREFISGLLTSRPSFTQKFGFFEIRARLPAGKALWPAFWLLPEDKSWPPEIDVFEVVGQQPDLIVQTVHWRDPSAGGQRKASGCRTRLPTASSQYHQYGVMWDEARLTYYIDRLPVAEIATPPGLDKKMYLLMNLAVGGSMVGRADQDTPLPAAMSIDWVAAYQRSPTLRDAP